jgi:uncharacterized RDD family membrane protein YckC
MSLEGASGGALRPASDAVEKAMADLGTNQRAGYVSLFAGPNLPAAAFAGVRTRRALAFAVDFVLVSIVALGIYLALLVATFGLSALLLPPLWPFVAFFYNGLAVSGRRGATPGMRFYDLEMRALDGSPVGFVMAGVHAVLLYLSWTFPVVFLVSLFTPDKRCLHDILAGVIVVRRPS